MGVCIIPARGGSKRIPRKNIREFCGRPIIGWSIAAASRAHSINRIVVSTDDEEIAGIAQAEGAEVPFRRDEALADDHAGTVPVIADAVRRLCLSDDTPVCCLYPTAPFVEPADLDAGLDLLRNNGADYVTSVTTFAYPVQRALRRFASGQVEMLDASLARTRSQDLEEAWHDAGQFYWASAKTWASEADLFASKAYGLPIPRHCVQDIDTQEDWARAELMMRVLQQERR